MKVAFLDRDGVLNKEVNYLHRIEDFEYTYRCVEALHNVQAAGYKIIVVTNQAGISRGYYTEEDYQLLTNWYRVDLSKQGIKLLDIAHCPHHPDGKVEGLSRVCQCRKPKPGMIIDMSIKHNIPLERAIMVGDKWSDVQAGQAAGVSKTMLVESGHPISRDYYDVVPTYKNLYELSLSL